jgi:hypothetical protein
VNEDDVTHVLGWLYLLYKYQTQELRKLGYSCAQAFWLNFACLPFLPWDQKARDQVTLTQVLQLYLGIHQFNTDNALKPQAVPAFIELLIDRYKMARNLVGIQEESRLTLELGRFALPGEQDPAKVNQAGLIVLCTITEWQKQSGQDRLHCRLMEDI